MAHRLFATGMSYFWAMIELYGIPSCDVVKKSMNWLAKNNKTYQFRNYKTEGISEDKLKQWLQQVPLEKLLNKKSTTWRELTPEKQAIAASETGAIALMQEHTSLIKRPVIERNKKVLAVGYDEQLYAREI